MARRKKQLGKEPTKTQVKDFQKCIAKDGFRKRALAKQEVGDKYDFKILNFNEDQTKWFCNLNNTMYLYNETTKKLLSYGSLFDDKDPLVVNSSKDIPWEEV